MTTRQATVIIGAAALIHAAVALAQSPRRAIFKSPDARSAVREYDAAVKKLGDFYANARGNITAKYKVEMEKLKKGLIEKLQEAQAVATKEADLDEALKIRDAITAYQKEGTNPPDANTELADAQQKIQDLEQELLSLKNKKPPEPTIPKVAAKFGGHSYVVFTDSVNWFLACKRCEAVGGHLVRIETPEEDAFVRRLVSSRPETDFWTDGSSYVTKPGDWRFTNGEPMKYFAWLEGQPNQREHSQAISVLKDRGHTWSDQWAGVQLGYICEWEE